jgi:hypothetical protein
LPFALRDAASARTYRTAITSHTAATPATTPQPAAAQTDATSAAPNEAAQAPKLVDDAALDALETRDPSTLSVDELVSLSAGRTERKRAQARELCRELEADPNRLRDPATRSKLVRLALDPDTSSAALASMSRAPSPMGPDLLFEVWSNRLAPSSVADLAHLLLNSREVRPGASPSLVVALDLRAASSCEDVRALLPRVQAEGDVRSVPALARLVPRRGCAPSKQGDCYACLRPNTPQLLSAIKAAQHRKVPRP